MFDQINKDQNKAIKETISNYQNGILDLDELVDNLESIRINLIKFKTGTHKLFLRGSDYFVPVLFSRCSYLLLLLRHRITPNSKLRL